MVHFHCKDVEMLNKGDKRYGRNQHINVNFDLFN